jgi:plasmid stabilization system protein ParE
VARIFSAVERLIQFPYSGRIVPERDKPEIREIIVGRFRVVYRVRDELLEVATVFRASREFPERF